MSVNQISGDGITIESFSDVWNDLVNGTPGNPGLLAIYGADANINQNSPDGQMVNNFANVIENVLTLLVQVYNAKDPDQAIGIDLDSVCALCGITRQGGTYTQVYVLINTSQALNLSGQDTSTPYTVQDGNGNQYQLVTSASLISGNNTLLFQAVNIGAIQCGANTVTIQVTVTAGINSINNPTAASVTGVNQETDAQLRLRRQVSVSLPAQGAIPGLTAGLYTIPAVLQAVVYENTTGVTNVNGVPGHSIWVIVDGANLYNSLVVAEMIYNYRNMGCGMYGSLTVDVVLPNGTLFPIMFDIAQPQLLYVKFHLSSINLGTVDTALVVSSLISDYQFTIYSPADITSVTALIKSIDPTLVVTLCQVSIDGINWLNSVYPSSLKDIFYLTTASITLL